MEQIGAFLESGVAPTALLIIRIIVPLLAGYVSFRCYTSFKAGQRRRDPVVMLLDESSGARFPVLYWENSVGRSRSCDICLPVAEVSRDHAVFMRREEGWFVCDTGSKGGVLVNGRRISGPRLVRIGDSMTFGGVTLTLYNTSQLPEKKRRFQAFLRGQGANPFFLMLMATIAHLLMADIGRAHV